MPAKNSHKHLASQLSRWARVATALFGSGAVLMCLGLQAAAAVRYVNLNSTTPTPPYTNWETAAVTIQEAVDVAGAGDEIIVTNGIYQTGGRAVSGSTTNRVAVTNALTLRSVNGPEVTAICGYQPDVTMGSSAVRCVWLANGANLVGFTLTNGATKTSGDNFKDKSGGGVWCATASAVVSNCVLARNLAQYGGGGAYSGTLYCCRFSSNSAASYGGGAYASTLSNCVLNGNQAYYGGATYTGTLYTCTLTANSAPYGGGANRGILNACTLVSNTASYWGGRN